MEILKVSSRSAPNSVAGAISGVIRESGAVEIQAVGAGATNQAVKSIAIARGYLAPLGIDLICIPAFAIMPMLSQNALIPRLSSCLRLLIIPSPINIHTHRCNSHHHR